MTSLDDCLCGRSQVLTSESKDTIVIDRKTFKQILALLGLCADQLEVYRHDEIFLTSLEKYLSEINTPEANKSLLLLNVWLDVVPEGFEDIAGWLDDARKMMKVILAASKMGAS